MASKIGDPLEAEIDGLEARLRESLAAKHFGDRSKMMKQLQGVFQQYDTSEDGSLQYEEFECAMVRDLNFVGVHRAIAGLFDRYDSDCNGRLSFDEFAEAVLGQRVRPTKEARTVVDRVKNLIISRGGANGIRTMTVILRRMDANGNKKLDEEELRRGLEVYGIHPTADEMVQLMRFFDRNGDRSISVTEFLRGIRGRMAKRRVKLVRMAYDLLDRNQDGQVTIQDIMLAYDASQHPDVVHNAMSEQQVLESFMQMWDKSHDGIVSWSEFLDYYKDISVSIDNDDYFELMMRNAWHISGGEGVTANTTNRRVLVTHEDGSQTVEEVKNDLGIDTTDMVLVRQRLEAQGIKDIKEVSLT